MGRPWGEMDAFTLAKTKAAKREYYRRNRAKVIASSKAYKAQHPERTRANVRRWHANRIRTNASYRISKMWLAAKHRAKRYGIPFDLLKSDLVIPEVCPVFGFKLEMSSTGGGAKKNSPSLDRIDPAKGYVRGNIQIISYLANAMKQNASAEELKLFAQWVLGRKE